jgi:DNA primase
VFKKYEISFKQQYSPSGWTHKALCPFKDHNEQTPSFSYNPQEDRFYCFGCQRGGKIVQFLGYMEDKSPAQVARELLKNILPDDEVLSEVQNEDERGKTFEVLVLYAKCLSDFAEKHNNDLKALKYAETVTWPLDAYIRNHLPSGTIVLEQLLGRVAILKEYLESYGDSE